MYTNIQDSYIVTQYIIYIYIYISYKYTFVYHHHITLPCPLPILTSQASKNPIPKAENLQVPIAIGLHTYPQAGATGIVSSRGPNEMGLK